MDFKIILKFLKFKLIAKLFFSLCLVYQTYILLEQYLKFNSIINIKFTTNVIDKLPAITFCYNRVISFQKMAQRYPENEEIYENYTKFVKKSSRYIFKNNRSYDELITKWNKFYFDQYQDMLERHQLSYLQHMLTKENYLTIFDNLSLNFSRFEKRCIHCSIHGDSGDLDSYIDGYYRKIIKSFPIESLDIKRNSKCFTFFYKPELTYLNDLDNIFEVLLTLEYFHTWFPVNPFNTMSFAIHSPNVKPEPNTFQKMDINSDNLAMFSKVEEKRLFNYDNCREYNQSVTDFETRFKCLQNCLFELTIFSCHDYLRRKSPYLHFRDELSNLSIQDNWQCEEMIKNYNKLTTLCKSQCKEDCYQAYYLSSFEKMGQFQPDMLGVRNKGGRLIIQPNSNPNILIEHFAEITFISLFGNFGGLLGMYLGVSLQSLFFEFWNSAKNIFSKYLWIKITNKIFNPIIEPNINVNIINVKPRFKFGLKRQRLFII